MNLPGISGLERLALLRGDPQWREPPVLLMSAQPEQAAFEDALREGLVTRFLRKPFDVDQLVREVRDVGSRTRRGGVDDHRRSFQ